MSSATSWSLNLRAEGMMGHHTKIVAEIILRVSWCLPAFLLAGPGLATFFIDLANAASAVIAVAGQRSR